MKDLEQAGSDDGTSSSSSDEKHANALHSNSASATPIRLKFGGSFDTLLSAGSKSFDSLVERVARHFDPSPLPAARDLVQLLGTHHAARCARGWTARPVSSDSCAALVERIIELGADVCALCFASEPYLLGLQVSGAHERLLAQIVRSAWRGSAVSQIGAARLIRSLAVAHEDLRMALIRAGADRALQALTNNDSAPWKTSELEVDLRSICTQALDALETPMTWYTLCSPITDPVHMQTTCTALVWRCRNPGAAFVPLRQFASVLRVWSHQGFADRKRLHKFIAVLAGCVDRPLLETWWALYDSTEPCRKVVDALYHLVAEEWALGFHRLRPEWEAHAGWLWECLWLPAIHAVRQRNLSESYPVAQLCVLAREMLPSVRQVLTRTAHTHDTEELDIVVASLRLPTSSLHALLPLVDPAPAADLLRRFQRAWEIDTQNAPIPFPRATPAKVLDELCAQLVGLHVTNPMDARVLNVLKEVAAADAVCCAQLSMRVRELPHGVPARASLDAFRFLQKESEEKICCTSLSVFHDDDGDPAEVYSYHEGFGPRNAHAVLYSTAGSLCWLQVGDEVADPLTIYLPVAVRRLSNKTMTGGHLNYIALRAPLDRREWCDSFLLGADEMKIEARKPETLDAPLYILAVRQIEGCRAYWRRGTLLSDAVTGEADKGGVSDIVRCENCQYHYRW